MCKSKKIVSYTFICILYVLFFSIMLRTFTRQILVKRLGMDNKFTEMVLFDSKAMQTVGIGGQIDENAEITVDINWAELYPFDDAKVQREALKEPVKAEGLDSKVELVKHNIDYYTSEFLPGYDMFIKTYQYYKMALNWNIMENSGEINVLHMQNGYLTYAEPLRSPSEINEMADSVADFNSFLRENGIDLYYINAGSKVDPDNRSLDSGVMFMENSNENADNLLKALEENGVNTIDMRTQMKADGLDWYQSYYITDHHWTNITGLWAAARIAEILNENNGFDYDLNLFDESSYTIEPYADFWYGGQATAIKLAGCKREEYDTVLPNFETSFIVDIPSIDYHGEGDYREAIFKDNLFDDIKEYSNEDFLGKRGPYSLVAWTNDALGTIVNTQVKNNQDKKILIIQDSFGWYSASFLACDTGEIDLIYPGRFKGSMREYIRQTKPDVVLVMYCERNISPIDLETHQSFFDFR